MWKGAEGGSPMPLHRRFGVLYYAPYDIIDIMDIAT